MKDDFSALERMTYSGRGIVMGMTPNHNTFVGYTLTGRSASSQARKLVYDEKNSVVRTEVTDKEQLEKGSPALLLYPAIVFTNDKIAASNGAQTNLMYTKLIVKQKDYEFNPGHALGKIFSQSSFVYDSKLGWIDLARHEPDSPNFTPRISAYYEKDGGWAYHKASKGLGGSYTHFGIDVSPGKSKLITTYKGGNENPLLPSGRDLLNVGISSETAKEIADSLYKAISHGATPQENYAVSAAVVLLNGEKPEVVIRNRFE
ncbi:MAG: IMP cyclohydrolase [Nanoarchaeota archaeon]